MLVQVAKVKEIAINDSFLLQSFVLIRFEGVLGSVEFRW